MMLFTEQPYMEYEIYSYNISQKEDVYYDRAGISISTQYYEFDLTITNSPHMDIFNKPSQMYLILGHIRYLLTRAGIITSVSYNSDQTMDITIRADEIVENADPEWLKPFLREDSINRLLTE